VAWHPVESRSISPGVVWSKAAVNFKDWNVIRYTISILTNMYQYI
jgi:hypothetical protein